MTPLQIRSLLAVFALPDEPMRPLAVGSLCLEGLIKPAEDAPLSHLLRSENYVLDLAIHGRYVGLPAWKAEHFELTDKGKVMVQALQDLSLPQCEVQTETVWTVRGTELEYLECDL